MGFAATTAITEFWAKCKSTFTTIDTVYPVGSIYMSVNSTYPGTLFGGMWTRLTDTFLLAAGTTYAADDGTHTTATGGSATHYHTTGSHKLTAAETGLTAHHHETANSMIVYNANGTQRLATSGSGTKVSLNNALANNLNTYDTTATAASSAHSHGNTGDSSSMPPYLTVYMWKRIA